MGEEWVGGFGVWGVRIPHDSQMLEIFFFPTNFHYRYQSGTFARSGNTSPIEKIVLFEKLSRIFRCRSFSLIGKFLKGTFFPDEEILVIFYEILVVFDKNVHSNFSNAHGFSNVNLKDDDSNRLTNRFFISPMHFRDIFFSFLVILTSSRSEHTICSRLVSAVNRFLDLKNFARVVP